MPGENAEYCTPGLFGSLAMAFPPQFDAAVEPGSYELRETPYAYAALAKNPFANCRCSEPDRLYEWPVFTLLSTKALVTAALSLLLVHRRRLSAPVNADCAAGKLALI